MENLQLPNLQELYLHRNRISKIQGLEYCPKLKKIWLFQNLLKGEIFNLLYCETTLPNMNLGDIGDGLYAVPELQVCWLQENQISSCNGFEQSVHLQSLALAGNPISSYKEVKYIKCYLINRIE